jgi:16S rRNA (cytosine1402-N4)-methyltransferase
MSHIPVLLNEVLQYINADKGGKFIDATVGGGGHMFAMLGANAKTKVMGIDLDQTSLDNLGERVAQKSLSQRTTLVQGNFKNIDELAVRNGFSAVDGILLDLGYSSIQLDDAKRGLSFQIDGQLDMRLDPSAEKTASQVVNHYQPHRLEKVITDFGEEKFARRITTAIMSVRKTKTIESTAELAEIIRQAIPGAIRFKANDNIRRVFQAIRIEVNDELESLKEVLPKAFGLLKPGGRLVIISFHSLEDRIVKEYFVAQAKGCVCPPDFPTCVCGKLPALKILTKKPIIAGEAEIELNSRSKSAKLRAVEKLTTQN